VKRRLGVCLIALLAPAALVVAQQTPVVNHVADVLRQARQEVSDFQKAGGKNTDPGHPAEKWAQELWKLRDASPGTADAAKATTEAVRLLVYADRFAEVQTRVDRILPEDPAWQGLARVLLDSASRQKSYTYFFAKLQAILSDAKDATTRAAVQTALGRAFRGQGEEKKAEAAFRAAIDLAAHLSPGKEAASQLYELLHLSVGQPAPTFSATMISGAKLSLADYSSKPLVLVFWGTY